ncbi:hypothetical protein F4678DRAFT_137899 [Xylaria arbuscula]|nr:hypothetical protein F4678DRAFT_137899 [Xylaria arbuscula]
MTTPYLRKIGRIVFTFVFISVFFYLASATSPPAASPAAETELICHTDNPAECYPKVFSATREFQVVHDDQDLPVGLHVQLDVQTGQKQAKLYNPDEEENPALAGLPVDHGVIVVDPDPTQDEEPKIRAGAPAYEPVGVVKAPREKNEDFSRALQAVKESSEGQPSIGTSGLDGALQLLDDLSHDMYYGLQIAEDTEVVQSLFYLLFRQNEDGRPLTERAEFIASSVLSAAIGNNAKALAAIESSWDNIAQNNHELGSRSIRDELFQRLAPTSEADTQEESKEAELIRLYLPVISGLLKSSKIRSEFLDNEGMQNFLQILLRDGAVWESRRAKTAQVVSDTFLDEDFGATLGLWPRKSQVDDVANCVKSSGAPSLGDECWAYHLDEIRQGPGAPEWSEQLLSLIRQAEVPGSASAAPPRHIEL